MRLLFTNFHEGDGGGHTTYVRTLAAALADRHVVHVAAPPGSRLNIETRALAGVTVWDQPFHYGLDKLAARRRARAQLRQLFRKIAFDVVHVNGSADHRLVLSALHGISPRPRLVLTKHNSKLMHGIGHWWRSRRTDHVIGVSSHTTHAVLHSAYGRCGVTTVHNGIDTDHYQPWPVEERGLERRKWTGDAKDILLLGSSAGTAPYKGWMDLVEALALLPSEQRVLIHLLIVGNSPPEATRQRIAVLGLTQQVHFPGLLADVRPSIAAIDAGFVLSWGIETISFACREMMAMGKPVLVSEYAGLPENIRPGRDGWSVPPRDHQAMAKALQRLLQERLELPSMGRAAREHAAESFGLEQFVERTEAVYTALLTSRLAAQSARS